MCRSPKQNVNSLNEENYPSDENYSSDEEESAANTTHLLHIASLEMNTVSDE